MNEELLNSTPSPRDSRLRNPDIPFVTRQMLNIRFSIKQLLAATAFIAIILFLLAPLRGILPQFYYEQYNTVRRKLENVKGLSITDSWKHEDMTLEDCGFDVTVDGTAVQITFVDGQDWAGLFDHIDGIRFASDGNQLFITQEQLQNARIKIDGLTHILEQLNEVVEFCNCQSSPDTDGNSDFQYNYENYRRYINIEVRR